jgi:hypothetical protein
VIGFDTLRRNAQRVADGDANPFFADIQRKNSKHAAYFRST